MPASNTKVCKICNRSTRTIHDGQFSIDYHYCPHCQYLCMDEAFILTPEKERQRYLQHINTSQDKGYVDMLHKFLEKSVFPYHNRIRTALDFGCGPGPVLAGILRNKNITVDAHDIFFAPGDTFKRKTYQLVTGTEVVEHLRDPLPVLEMLSNLLEPGGLLALMTLFHPMDSGDQQFKKWWYRRDPTHISFFTPRTFSYLSDHLDMKLIYIDNKNTLTLQKPL